jgi:glutamyl-Q tRNA(Asp) synthetase
MQPVTRFAPSPTGRLHLGHAYSALLAHDYARERDGSFLLRIEDIDSGRARSEHVDAIFEDLLWLGLDWDGEIIYQSERLDLYAEALDRLQREQLIYPCFCTRAEIAAEIAASAEAPHGAAGPSYPGTCRALAEGERRRLLSEKPHAWRLDVTRAIECAGPLSWYNDAMEVTARPDLFGDVVLARKDAPASYHLAVTVDDAALGVTDIVRGRDLYESTHVHRLLQALLGLPTPTWHHHQLLIDDEGQRLAKRQNAPTLADLRASGIDPAALLTGLRAGQLPSGFRVQTHFRRRS